MTAQAHVQTFGAAKTSAYLVMVSVMATVMASVIGLIIALFAVFPLSLIAIVAPLLMLYLFWNGLVWAAPVTLVLLPIVAVLGRRRPTMRYLALPIIGLVGGLLTVKAWAAISTNFPELAKSAALVFVVFPPKDEYAIFAGLAAGFASGAFFSAATREMRP